MLSRNNNNKNNMEETLFDVNGNPVAYIAYSDEETIYLWGGEPVAYLDDDSIYGFNGIHLGWYEDGVIRDHDGNIVGTNEKTAAVFVKFEPFKGFKKFKPFKAFKQFEPFKPFYHTTQSSLPLDEFLQQGER